MAKESPYRREKFNSKLLSSRPTTQRTAILESQLTPTKKNKQKTLISRERAFKAALRTQSLNLS